MKSQNNAITKTDSINEYSLRNDANQIIERALCAVQPDNAVKKALENIQLGKGRIFLVAIGKAAWQMSYTAWQILGEHIEDGIVITKYHHSNGEIGSLKIYEAGHPIPDENSYKATSSVIDMVNHLTDLDTVLFLVSGGGSALFEMPLISEHDMQLLTQELLASGADIKEINTIRKRFSAVKGGKFATLCAPAKVFSIVLSDIIGDPLDMIASGPAYPDSSTCEEAICIAQKYQLTLSEHMMQLLKVETPKTLDNVESHITGSVRQLCISAEDTCRELGYDPFILTTELCCTARDAGVFLSNIAQHHQSTSRSLAFIAGGETIVKLTGNGLGGRNQELALASAIGIANLANTAIFSIGSDGTDGPTDAAGGYVDGNTFSLLKKQNIDIHDTLGNNDAYHGLKACNGLIVTGPTGTNVNDLAVLLIKR